MGNEDEFKDKNLAPKCEPSVAVQDEESIDTLAACQLNKTAGGSKVLLCAGTSKGNICVWELTFNKKPPTNDSNNNNDSQVKFTKLKVFKQAHGKHEIDELQVGFV